MPIVANDMHLGLSRPALFHLVGLHAPGWDAVGMGIPGAPGVAAGRSGAVAWGYTNAMVDDADFFVERVDPVDTTRYLTPDGSEPFRTRLEVIEVAGGATPDSLVVRETRHGPVMTPVEARLDEELVALRWVAHADSSTLPAILAMNRATNAAEFEEALRGFRTINQNVVFADTAGQWGYRMAGRVPLRGGARPPIAPRPGWTGDSDWTGFLPFDEHPSALAPEAGFVVTANNRQQTDSIGGLVSGDMWFPPWRAERITRRVEASDTHDVPSTHAIQLDIRSLQGERFASTAAEGYRGAGDVEAAALLDAWDGTAAVDRIEPTLFEAWYEAVRQELRREVYGGDSGFVHVSAVDRWIEGGLPDVVSTRAATEALERVGRTEWGHQHYLHLDHPLGSVPLLQRLFGFARTDIPIGGTGATVDVAGHATDASGRYRVVWGASQRHVSDLSEDAGWFVLPGGQSGYPAGAHSADQLPRWLGGGLMRLPLGREEAEARTLRRWRITPP
jgi:penicillin amidase